MRIAIAGFMHESNTFNPVVTDRAAFEAQSLLYGEDLIDEWRDAHHEIGGFLEAAKVEGFEPVPIVMAWATPGGPVAGSFFEGITASIIREIYRTKPDGLLLALHGAMVAESYPDADGEVLARLRHALGPTFPIVLTLDLHGNLSPRLIDLCQAAVAYRTYPHVDQRECGRRAGSLLVRMLRKEIQPRMIVAKPPVMINIMAQDTACDPMKGFIEAARDLEQ